MSQDKLSLEWVPGTYAVCRLAPDAEEPPWASAGGEGLRCVVRTERELSIIAPSEEVPEDVQADRGWVAMQVAETLDFSLVGILARLTGALAEAGIPIFAVSTYDTDILLVRARDVSTAVDALESVADVSGLGRQ